MDIVSNLFNYENILLTEIIKIINIKLHPNKYIFNIKMDIHQSIIVINGQYNNYLIELKKLDLEKVLYLYPLFV